MERPPVAGHQYGNINPENFSATQQSHNMWDFIDAATTDCECPGPPPPPEFLLPPPPKPPALQSADPAMFCNDNSLSIETCDALPLIDASYRSSQSSQTLAVIILCSVLLGLFLFIVIILVWKYKRVQNFLPCKNSTQNNCDAVPTATGLYEDLNEMMPRHTVTSHHHHHQLTGGHIVAPSIEMIDVKNNIHYPSGYPISPHPPVFLCSSPGPDPYCSQDLYNPVYEELSDADTDIIDDHHHHLHHNHNHRHLHHHRDDQSEDEFAEDELSLAGEMDRRRLEIPPPPYRPTATIANNLVPIVRRDVPKFRRPHEPLPPIPNSNNRRHRSLDRRRQEFHEGMLLDALLQLYPRVDNLETTSQYQQQPQQQQQRRQQIPSIAQRIQCISTTSGPYETVPVISHLATFRPIQMPKTLYSQDSALGSDSGYSNHTTSGTSRGSSSTNDRGG